MKKIFGKNRVKKRLTKKKVFLKKFISTAAVCALFDIMLVIFAGYFMMTLVTVSEAGTKAVIKDLHESGNLSYARYISCFNAAYPDELISFSFTVYDSDGNLKVCPENSAFLLITDSGSDFPLEYYYADESVYSLMKGIKDKYDVVSTRDDPYDEQANRVAADSFYVKDGYFYPLTVTVSDNSGNKLETLNIPCNIPEGGVVYQLDGGKTAEIEFFDVSDTEVYEMTKKYMESYNGDTSMYTDNYGVSVTEIDFDGERLLITEAIFVNDRLFFRILLSVLIPVSLVICLLIAALRAKAEYSALSAAYAMEDYRRDMTDKLAHDLKSPLMVISGYAENLEQNINTDKREHYASAILENVRYMDEMIGSVLELSRLEEESGAEPADLDGADICRSITDGYNVLAEKNRLTFAVNGSAPMRADSRLLRTVLDNLISNAVKYCDAGGRITVDCENGRITVTNDCENAGRLDAKDIVKPFVKGDSSRSGRNGSGLGLSIAAAAAGRTGLKLDIRTENKKFIAVVSQQR